MKIRFFHVDIAEWASEEVVYRKAFGIEGISSPAAAGDFVLTIAVLQFNMALSSSRSTQELWKISATLQEKALR